MIGQLHYRVAGRIGGLFAGLPRVRSCDVDGRYLIGHVAPWGKPALFEPDRDSDVPFLGWYTRGCVDLGVLPELRLKHDGERVGQCVELVESVSWLDAVFEVDEGPLGDAVLGLADELERLPLSGTYDGHARWHTGDPPGLEYTRGRLLEVAMVPEARFEGAYVVGRSSWPEGECG